MTKVDIRKIVITGVHQSDIVMYCAFVLQALGGRVLVYDQTQIGVLKYAIRRPDKPMELVRYGEVDFAFSELAVLDDTYAYIIYMQDFSHIGVPGVYRQIYVCDGIRVHIDAMLAHMSVAQRKQSKNRSELMILYRDLYHSFSVDYFKAQITGQWTGINVQILQHDCMDEAVYQRIQFQPFSCFSELSSEMEQVIRELICYAAGLDTASAKRAIKLAKRRRIG